MATSIVQSGYQSTTDQSLVISLPSPPTPGNALVVFARGISTDPDPLLVTSVDSPFELFWYRSSDSTGNMGVTALAAAIGASETVTTVEVSNGDHTWTQIEAVWAEVSSDEGPLLLPIVDFSLQFHSEVGPGTGPVDIYGSSYPFVKDEPRVGFVGLAWEDVPGDPADLMIDGLQSSDIGGPFPDATLSGFAVESAPGDQLVATWSNNPPSGAFVLAVGFIVNTTKYSIVQNLHAPASIGATTENNLVAFSAWSASTPPEVDGWTRVVRQVDEGVLSIHWKVADGTETISPMLPVIGPAIDYSFIEATGFEPAPTMHEDTTGEFVDSVFVPVGPPPENSFTWPLGGEDAFMLSAFGFSLLPEYAIFLQDLSHRSPTSDVLVGGGFSFLQGGAPIGGFGVFSEEASGATASVLFVDGQPPAPNPPQSSVIFCPKSVRGCAVRFTRLNDSNIPLDPLTPNSRIQTSGFIELSISPDVETGSETAKRRPSTGAMSIIDRECDTLKGLNVDLRLCGVPMTVLEMLTGTNALVDGAAVVGGALRDGKVQECQNLVMVEIWSRNVGSSCDQFGNDISGRWIQWVLPRTLKWSVTGSMTFENGPLEVTLSGYAEQNPVWYPSLPGADFPSYEPGGGDPDGWPVGDPPAVLPDGLTADPWTTSDQSVIRSSGPLAWRAVESLPEPLSDCEYLTSFHCSPYSTSYGFCGAAGDPLPEPWFFYSGLPCFQPPTLSGSCSVGPSPEARTSAFVPVFGQSLCCDEEGRKITASGVKSIFEIMGSGPLAWQLPAVMLLTREGYTVSSFVFAFENVFTNTFLLVHAVTVTDETYSTVASYSSTVTISEDQFMDGRWEQSLGWTEGGVLMMHLSTGDLSLPLTFTNAADYLSVDGAMVIDYGGIFFGQLDLNVSQDSTISDFSISCGLPPQGTVVDLDEAPCDAVVDAFFGETLDPVWTSPVDLPALTNEASPSLTNLPPFGPGVDPVSGAEQVAVRPSLQSISCCRDLIYAVSLSGPKTYVVDSPSTQWSTPAVVLDCGDSPAVLWAYFTLEDTDSPSATFNAAWIDKDGNEGSMSQQFVRLSTEAGVTCGITASWTADGHLSISYSASSVALGGVTVTNAIELFSVDGCELLFASSGFVVLDPDNVPTTPGLGVSGGPGYLNACFDESPTTWDEIELVGA